jgi:hypothetical protein
MKKPHLLIIGLLLFTSFLTAQSIERQFIGVAGGNNTNEQIFLDWTLGEPFTAYDNTLIGIYKEGFLQPVILNQNQHESITDPNNELSDQITAEVFPNPFSGAFTFQISEAQEKDAQLTILDYSGKNLIKKIFPAGSLKMEWTMSDYPAGLYFLQFADDSGILRQSFKLLKL